MSTSEPVSTGAEEAQQEEQTGPMLPKENQAGELMETVEEEKAEESREEVEEEEAVPEGEEKESGVRHSTRLRSGRASKIDYLKLHNAIGGGDSPSGHSPAPKRRPAQSYGSPRKPKEAAGAVEAKRPKLAQTPFVCPQCNSAHNSSKALDNHVVQKHPKLIVFRCIYCLQYFRTARVLQNHYVRQHRLHATLPDCLYWDIQIQCRACGRSFLTADLLANHMESVSCACNSIVLMEKLNDDWQTDMPEINESAAAVTEEYDLAFPGRSRFYSAHPSLLDVDLSIELKPAASGANDGLCEDREIDPVNAASTDESTGRVGASPAPKASAPVRRRRRRRQPADASADVDLDAQAGEAPAIVPSADNDKQQQQQHQRRVPFASDTPHYVSSRANLPKGARRPYYSATHSFPCPICMEDMGTLKSRDRHLRQRHPGVRAFACLECECTFETFLSLRQHMRAEHPGAESGAYKLLIAPGLKRRAGRRSAVVAAAATSAAASAGGLKPFLCTVCGVSFDQVDQLSAHYSAVHETVGAGGGGRAGKQQQQRDHGGESTGQLDQLKLTCEICAKQFDKITSLERHIAVDHVDETPYECSQCPAYFQTFGRLRHHQKTVHRLFMQWKEAPQSVLTKLRKSPTSGVLNVAVPVKRSDMARVAYQQLKFFDEKSAASIDLDSVLAMPCMTETVIFCDFCGEPCHNKLELGRHLQSHSGKRIRYGCSKCGQVFEGWNAKNDLVDHMKVDHMGKPRYRCNVCEAQFKYSSLLKLHKSKGCNSPKSIVRPLISYGCSNCEKIFCGELSCERYQHHLPNCKGQLNRSLPSNAAVAPPPTAVISGLNVDPDDYSQPSTTTVFSTNSNQQFSTVDIKTASADQQAGLIGGGQVVQLTLPGSK